MIACDSASRRCTVPPHATLVLKWQVQVKPRKPWTEIFPNATPQAIALLDSMLIFNPSQRCTMVDALNCEYMTALHQGRELPPTETTFSFDFEKPDITQDELRELIWSEMANFHPELR